MSQRKDPEPGGEQGRLPHLMRIDELAPMTPRDHFSTTTRGVIAIASRAQPPAPRYARRAVRPVAHARLRRWQKTTHRSSTVGLRG